MAVSTVPPAADAESGARVSTAAPGRDHRIALGVIVLVGAFLRFFELSRQGFWLDEASQIRTSRLIDEQGLREVAKRDNVSPLSHWLLWAWDKIAGDGQFAARVPSAVAGIVTILIVYALGRRLYSSTVGLVAAAVLAISPYAIWYSQDARMYSLLLCATAAMLLVFHLAITEPKRVRWWVLLAVVTTIGIYTHQYAALTTAGCAVYLVVAREWRGTIGRRWLAANAVAALAFLPWLLIASANDAGTAGSEKTAALLWLPYSMFSFLFGFSLGPSIRENQELGAVHAVKPDLWWIIPLAFAAAVVLLVALRNALTRGPRRSNLLCACTFVTPMVLAIAIPVVSSKISFNVRYVVMALPPLLVLLAVVVLDARPRRVLAICVATLTVATALSLVNWYTDDRYAKEDLSAAGPYLATHVVGGDRVYVSSWTVAESLDTFGFHAPVTKVYAGTLPATVDEIRRNLPSTTSAIWLVEARTWESDKDGALRAVLDANARLDVEATWPGLDIRRYTVR